MRLTPGTTRAPQEALSPWLHCFHDSLELCVASPGALVGPYHVVHQGAQAGRM